MITISRRKKRKNAIDNKLFIIIFFILLLFLSYKVIGSRNKIVNFDIKDTSYVELISFEKNTMKTIKDNVKLRGIITKINGLKGEEVNMENEGLSAMDFINIYDKSFKKTVVGRNNNYLKINDKWYKLDSRSSKNFENIFNQYN